MVMREAELMYGGNSDASYDDIYGTGSPTDIEQAEDMPIDQTANAVDETVDVGAVKSLVKQLGAMLGLTVSDPAEEIPEEEAPVDDGLGEGYPEEEM